MYSMQYVQLSTITFVYTMQDVRNSQFSTWYWRGTSVGIFVGERIMLIGL